MSVFNPDSFQFSQPIYSNAWQMSPPGCSLTTLNEACLHLRAISCFTLLCPHHSNSESYRICCSLLAFCAWPRYPNSIINISCVCFFLCFSPTVDCSYVAFSNPLRLITNEFPQSFFFLTYEFNYYKLNQPPLETRKEALL